MHAQTTPHDTPFTTTSKPMPTETTTRHSTIRPVTVHRVRHDRVAEPQPVKELRASQLMTVAAEEVAWFYTSYDNAPSALLARVAVDLLLERDTERLTLPLVTRRPMRLPPEPLRWPLLNGAQRVLQAADDRGGARGPLGRGLIRLLQ